MLVTLLALLGLAPCRAAACTCTVSVTKLTVDYSPAVFDPVQPVFRFSDRPRPLLGWQLSASPASAHAAALIVQTAYRVYVASQPSLAFPGLADIWDSDVVVSNASVAVPFGGAPLASGQRVFWRVQIWSNEGRAAGAAECDCGVSATVGAWEVPLLTDADWHGAAWLTRDAPHPPVPDCAHYADDPAPLLRHAFVRRLPGALVVAARLYVAGVGYFTPSLDGVQVGDEALAPGWTNFNRTVLYSGASGRACRGCAFQVEGV